MSSKKRKVAAAQAVMKGGRGRDPHQDMSEFMKGSIVRIKMVNFVTYDNCEVFPGPHLNMIMGPNGTGKSTLVCAMCLCLNGSTNLLDRAKEIGEFVKRGTNQALIELELYNPSGRNHVITREIMRQGNRSHFYLNNNQIKGRELTQFVAQLNIQITNLCQFLPQEKVKEFSQMTNVELLERTEQAIGTQGLYDDHQALKECRSKEKELQQQLKDKEQHLEGLRKQNERVERDVQRFQERQKTLEKIETLEKKRVWLQYDSQRVLFEKCKQEKKKVEEQLAEKQRRGAPLEDKLKKLDSSQKKLEQQMKELTAEISKYEKLSNKKRNEMGDLTGQIAEVQEDLKEKKSQEQARLKTIHSWKQLVAGYKRELEQLEPDENIKPKLDENLADINEVSRKIQRVDRLCSDIKSDRENIMRENKALKDRLKKLNDMRDQRLRTLRNMSQDTVNAVMWLRSNKEMFKKTVHEPIALVLNIENKNNAKYIEKAIPRQDMLAFVCEDSDDQDLFLSEVREKQRLRVSVVKSPKEPLDSFKPRVPNLGFGFHSYLRDLVSAPDAVMAYLCKMHKLHLIPLGNEDTERNVEQVIEHSPVQRFYTPKYQYGVKQSRYGNRNKSLLSSLVPEAKILGVSTVDVNEKRDIEMQIQEKEKQIQEQERQYKEHEKEHRELNVELERLREARQVLNRSKNQRRTITQNIRAKLDAIKKKENTAIDLEEEKQKARQKIKQINSRKMTLLGKICEIHKICLDRSMAKVSVSMQYQLSMRAKTECEDAMKETEAENLALEAQLRDLENETKQVRVEAKALLAAARQKTGSDKPSDHLKALFDQYPNDIDMLEDLIHREQAQADCQYQTDENVVKDYKLRCREIKDVETEVSRKREELESHRARISRLKETWLQELKELVQQINEKFSHFFSCMGCAGDVVLHCPSEEDYDKYEMHIRVKFRRNEQLQLLTSTYQSGGERSVATVLYLMALQKLNKCPFRVVDEINQGMDPNNERKVFQFVVETVCSEVSSQYFLITPKLLPNLRYGPKMKVLCVYNSHWMLPHNQWNIDKFVQRKKELDAA